MIHTVYMYVLHENAMAASHPKLKSNFSNFRKSKDIKQVAYLFYFETRKNQQLLTIFAKRFT